MHKQGNGNRLAELRAARGLKRVHVGAHVDRDPSVIARYETGDVQIPDDVKALLASLFGVTRAYLMGWDETTPESEEAAA
jgi:transcriptional regulator with XRE-family HTH domain